MPQPSPCLNAHAAARPDSPGASSCVPERPELTLQDFFAQEQDRVERLVLSGSGDTAVNCQTSQKLRDALLIKFVGMALGVEKNITANPADICFFSSQTVMPQSHELSHSVQQ